MLLQMTEKEIRLQREEKWKVLLQQGSHEETRKNGRWVLMLDVNIDPKVMSFNFKLSKVFRQTRKTRSTQDIILLHVTEQFSKTSALILLVRNRWTLPACWCLTHKNKFMLFGF